MKPTTRFLAWLTRYRIVIWVVAMVTGIVLIEFSKHPTQPVAIIGIALLYVPFWFCLASCFGMMRERGIRSHKGKNGKGEAE